MHDYDYDMTMLTIVVFGLRVQVVELWHCEVNEWGSNTGSDAAANSH